MASRRQRSSKESGDRPAYRKILDQAVHDLGEHGFDRFSVQRVLQSAGVSRATLYHHFRDVDGLIEAALVEMYSQLMEANRTRINQLIEGSKDAADFRAALEQFLGSLSLTPPEIRLQRAHTIALTRTRPELAAAIAEAQEMLTDGWDSVIDEAQKRGFVRRDFDSRAAAVIIQSITLGRIVDDAAVTHVGDERWAASFFDFVDRTLLTPQS